MIKWKNIFLGCVVVVLDGLAYIASLTLAYTLRNLLLPHILPDRAAGLFPLSHYLIDIWWYPALLIAIFAHQRLYTRRWVIWDETRNLVTSLILTFFIFQAVVALGKLSLVVSRSLYAFVFLFSLPVFPLVRYWGKTLLYHLRLWNKRVAIVGTDREVHHLAHGLQRERSLGFEIIGFIDTDDRAGSHPITIGDRSFPILGPLRNLQAIVENNRIESVVLPIASFPEKNYEKAISDIQSKVYDFYVIPELSGLSVLNSEINHLFPEEFYLLKIKNNLLAYSNRFIKRVIDLMLTAVLVVPVSLLIALLMVLIRIESRGNPIFIDRRWGRGGRTINVFKLRSMYTDSDRILDSFLKQHPEKRKEWDRFKKIKGADPRLTRMGKFLRKFSLDELPQLYNVLLGNMSLVGPRPYLPKEKKDIGDYLDLILSVKPGVTGLWQISGRNELEFSQRLRFDYIYINNWSLWLDFIILLKTMWIVVSGKGSY